MPRQSLRRARVPLAVGLDAALLLVFVMIGRASHGEGLWGALGTWWPFLVGLGVAWLVLRAWRAPAQIVWTGLGIWMITVGVGLLLRMLSGQGVQLSFVIVTFLVVGAFLVGWRGIALLLTRSRRPGATVG